ncbi:glutamate-rich protein 6-like isoform X2 [Tubulanus polymorphus]|uniref:glutamate-rich protein 6-like isoform X2 n=1 Tax=Tubulanus polymorphus TaxID=672921 RepID=UPI003DA33C2A
MDDQKPESTDNDERNARQPESAELTVENVRLLADDSKDNQEEEKSSFSKSQPDSTGASRQAVASESGELSFTKGKPLPPIGSRSFDGAIAEDTGTSELDNVDTSMKAPKTSESRASAKSSGSRSSKTVSFIDGESSRPATTKQVAKSVTKKLGIDGIEYTMVTIETQTEWSWLEDMKTRGNVAAPSQTTAESSTGRIAETKDNITNNKIAGSAQPETGSGMKKTAKKPKRKASSSELPVKESSSSPVYPEAVVDDEYGIPMLDVSSDSDFSDIDENDKVIDDVNEKDMLPSIGPPQILQYKRESEEKMVELEDPDVLLEQQGIREIMDEMASGKCHFCSNGVKPFPSQSDQKLKSPEELYCCDGYREFVQFTLTHPLVKENERDRKISIKPHAPYGSKQARRAARERAQLRMRERELQKQQAVAQASASGAQQSNFFSNSASRFTDPSSRVESVINIARQMKTINYQLSSQKCLEEGWTVRPPSPLGDQDKLADVFEAEPLTSEFGDEDDLEFGDRLDAADGEGLDTERQSKAWRPHAIKGRRRMLIQRFYGNGKKFLTIFPDGSGNVFYPSGNIAIVICRINRGQLSYVVHDDCGLLPPLLASFEPSGYGCCYYQNGSLRLHLDQLGGIEHDMQGARKRRWTWKDFLTHVHAPPFQPICFAVNSFLSIRVISQEKIALTFRAKDKSCRFNVGTRLKLLHPELLPPREIDEDQLYINDVKAQVETLLNKVSNLLKFPKSPKLDAMKPPHHVTSLVEKNEKMKLEISQSTSSRKNNKKGQGQGLLPVVRVN